MSPRKAPARPRRGVLDAWISAQPRAPRPAEVLAPWGARFLLGDDELYREQLGTAGPLSHPALADRIDRHRERGRRDWQVTAAGVPWLAAGERVAVLWPDPAGTWAVGHLALDGGGGVWLGDGLARAEARDRAEAWAAEQGAPWRVVDSGTVSGLVDPKESAA